MSAKVFVGGLAWATTSDSLRERFEEFGEVVSATVVSDRETGRSRGFGFVEFAEAKDAEKSVEGMRDQDLDGRTIRVDIANDRPPRRDRDDAPRERRDYGGDRRDDRGGDRRDDRRGGDRDDRRGGDRDDRRGGSDRRGGDREEREERQRSRSPRRGRD